MISNSGNSLLNIINDILDHSKIEAGKMQLEITPFYLGQIIDELTSIFSFMAEEKHIKLSSTISPDTPLMLKGDPTRLRQILLNLLGNAIKFTHQGEIRIRVRCEHVTDQSADLRFEVIDTGIGISQENQEKLFHSFEQADTSITRKYGGTGLGLTISKQLVELMNGEIGVESTEQQGSTFWFTAQFEIPSADDVNLLEKEQLDTEVEPIHSDESNRLNILVAEDNTVNQMVISGLLKNLQIQPTVVNNGLDAVNTYKESEIPYDLILMDCEMPGLDGYRATQQIRQYEIDNKLSRVPIIALTAHAMSEHREKSLKAGMDDHLSKPVSQNNLATILQRYTHIRYKQA